jgi:hypothetical protein
MLLIKSILLSFSLLPMPWAELDFSYLDYNSCFYEAASKSFFQVIYCDVDTNQVLEITNRTSHCHGNDSTMCIENDNQSFIGDNSNQPNGDNS